jgi:hypothetical protein
MDPNYNAKNTIFSIVFWIGSDRVVFLAFCFGSVQTV